MTCSSTPPSSSIDDDRSAELRDRYADFVRTGDEPALRKFVRRAWPLADLASAIYAADAGLRCTAVHCLGIIGGRAALLPLVGALRHEDALVARSAENALWRLWLRAAGVGAQRGIRRASDALRDGRYESAMQILDDLAERFPDFAEAYHQRAVARSLNDDVEGAIEDYTRAIRCQPCHFAAMVGLADSLARMGRTAEAMQSYRAALKVNPRMAGVRQAIRRMRPPSGPDGAVVFDESDGTT